MKSFIRASSLMMAVNSVFTLISGGCFVMWWLFPERLPLNQAIPALICVTAALWLMWRASFSLRALEQKHFNERR